MPNFYVEWSIDIEADTAEEAARKALAIQRKPDSTATVFKVTQDGRDQETIDLTEIDDAREAAALKQTEPTDG